MKNKIKFYKFSLIELLIVIGILGVLSSLLLPAFHGAEDEAKKNTAKAEMKSIQHSFLRFSNDINFRSDENKTNKKLLDITKYGLWPLLIDHHPVLPNDTTLQYDDYDADTEFGRRAPYLEYDGLMVIDANSVGQEADSSNTTKIPVIKDPYGGYYRVIFPNARPKTEKGQNYNEFKRLQRMVLVCTGPDRKLDTKVDSFINTADAHEANANDLVAQNDDFLIRLMPFAGF